MNSRNRLEILQERNSKFGDYIKKKASEGGINISNLKKIAKLGAQRTINELNYIIKNIETKPDLGGVSIDVREAERQTYIGIKDALEECNKLLLSIDNDNSKNFLKSFISVNNKLTSIFNFIEKTKIFISKKLENKENKSLRWFLDLIENGGKLIKEAGKRISKIIIIGGISTSIATAGVNNEIPHIRQEKARIVQTIINPEYQNKAIILKSLQENHEKLKSIPDFDKKIKKISDRLKKEEIFNPKNYKRGETWKIWNDEIVGELFPNKSIEFSEDEKKIIIKAFQKVLKTPTFDGEFGRSSREYIIKSFSQKSNETRLIKSQNKNLDEKTNYDAVKRKISLEEFEKALLRLEGTKFISGLSDCSNLFFKLFYKLELVNFEIFKIFGHGSTSIMQQLTTDIREFKDAKKGDFIYWSSTKYKGAKHIAYVFETNEKGIWIFDRSIDTGKTVKRFIERSKFAEKNDCIVGKPIFIV